MYYKQLKELIAQGESDALEFKTSTSKLKSAFETVCGFLNNNGGTVLIGVNDSGKIIGQNVTETTKREIATEIKKIEPHSHIDVQYVKLSSNKYVIVITTEQTVHAPYVYGNRPFQRNQSQTNKMTQHCYEQLIIKRAHLNHSWEKFQAKTETVKDLDENEIIKTIHDGISNQRIPAEAIRESTAKFLQTLGLVSEQGLTNAAVVLFGKNINMNHPRLLLKMGRFQGSDVTAELTDNQQYNCNAFNMLEHINNFTKKHLYISSSYDPETLKRIDKPTLPVLAVREAMINAICHRDYMKSYGYISVAIFNDRMEIWNNGTLPAELTFKDLKKTHNSVLRNELISKVFYLRGYIESWGMGTLKIINLCKEHLLPEPSFSERTGGFLITFPFKQAIGELKQEITDRQKKIISLLQNKSLSAKNIADKLSISVRTIQVELEKLKKAGYVIQEGMARATKWRAK